MALHSRHERLIFFVLTTTTILSPSQSLILHCDDTTPCADKSYRCSDEICGINCITRSSCEYTYFECDSSYLHGECQINCAGRAGCELMMVQSFRDTHIVCSEYDSCDRMDIGISGLDPNDKISATFTSIGGYTDGTYFFCEGDGIDECFLDCHDNGEFYSCIDMRFDCFTPGICRFRCENSNACCGCTVWNMFTPHTYNNSLHCYEGSDNCIQEDPGGCVAEYGCIATYYEPTFEPTEAPTMEPTYTPTLNPTMIPSLLTSIPTKAPTTPPTARPTQTPTRQGETAHPSTEPTTSPTSFPSTNPTVPPSGGPSDDPTHRPTNMPSVIPTVSPILRPTLYPTPDQGKAACVSIVESIENVIGVTAEDFRRDNELQKYVMNSTKAVIYEAFKISHIYDMEQLCKDFWRCFYLTLKSIRGDTILDIDVCAWTHAVHRALRVKIVDNAEEMGAYMKKGLAWYLVDGPTYSGYGSVIIDDLTRVTFRLFTPRSVSTTMDFPVEQQPDKVSGSPVTVAVEVVAVILICVCLLIVGLIWYRKNTIIKRELLETKQRVWDLEALTGVEGDGADLDHVEPEEEGGEGTVATNTTTSGNGYQQANAQENEEVPYSGYERVVPGSVACAAGVEMVSAPEAIPELPELKDAEAEEEEEEEEDAEESSSSDNDETDALYTKQGSLGDALYGPGTKTDGNEEHVTPNGGKDNENDSQNVDQE